MDQFRADLHIHSRYSRATSRKLTPRNLAAWARVKGLDVVATGDFTHPGWLAEIEEHLVEDGSGLLQLRDPGGLEKELSWLAAPLLPGGTKFMLSTEISSIYKRGGKVRKIHNLVYMPSLEQAKRFNDRLRQIGNLESDGRPILGLDAEHLLELVLESGSCAFLIPAHIWTPWFSLFGSKSGFDTIEECFGELSREIFALETGLSSDPEMNWQWSRLDRFRLVSNSDAHSGENLGRECNLFSGTPSFEGIYRALRGEGLGHKFLGTVEFYPEEGKYHMDGHRKCNVVMEPRECQARGGRCPVCGKPVTVGVLNRVLALADREAPERPAGSPGFTSLIPLPEILSEILGTGPKSKRVAAEYAGLIARFGPELTILQRAPLEDLARWSPLLAEGIGRMRCGRVRRQPGFDGEYGRISVFTTKESQEFRKGKTLFDGEGEPAEQSRGLVPAESADAVLPPDPAPVSTGPVQMNEEQLRAVLAGPGPVLVLAGPGTGKTHTLLARIRHLLEQGVNPRQILVLTFTRRAAGELKSRLVGLLGEEHVVPRADTLHALAFENWVKVQGHTPVLMSEEDGLRVFQDANPQLGRAQTRHLWVEMSKSREQACPCPEHLVQAAASYARQKSQWNLVDFTDLLEFWREQIGSQAYFRPYNHILVDEVQDLTPLQLELIKVLAPPGGHGFFAIGDVNQSIYSFRGAVGEVRANLQSTWGGLNVVTLRDNYRSNRNILDVSRVLIPENGQELRAVREGSRDIHFFRAGTGAQEASWMGDQIRALIGGTSHWQADLGPDSELNPGEIAVLVRFRGLMPLIHQTLTRLGLPCGMPEEEAFWVEPRVQLILESAGRLLGLKGESEDHGLNCPDRILAQGPSGLNAYLKDIPPFDQLFWQSSPFLELKKRYAEHGGWGGLLNWIHLQSELEQVRARAERVQIMSLHAAKGLEFEAVFMPAMEDGILPFAGKELLSGKPIETERVIDEEEEKRLCYVGLTRAKSRLFLSCAAKRRIYSKIYNLQPSRFLGLLPDSLLKKTTMVARKLTKTRQIPLL
jgi:uncharacterized protein (TIGR00375 family)